MAKQSNGNKFFTKTLVALSVIFLLCVTAFFAVACGNKNDDYTEKDYSQEWTDDAKIVNGSFEFGSDSLEASEFPQTSANNWTLATNDSAQSSVVNSGIISVKYWDELLKTLYDDSDFLSYAEKKYDFTVSKYKQDYPDKSDDEIKSLIISEQFSKIKNPGTHKFAKENEKKIYMINNYASVSSFNSIGIGTAQQITSSTSIKLEKGSVGRITVYVKTANLSHIGLTDGYGANIRLTNTVSSTTQAQYRISAINTETMSENLLDENGWARFDIYVKADDFIDNSVVVVLGLGYGDGASLNAKDFCEGTAYFDDVTFTEVSADKFDETNEYLVKYETSAKTPVDKYLADGIIGDEEIESVHIHPIQYFVNMDMNKSVSVYAPTYFNNVTAAITNDFTVSQSGVSSVTRFGTDSTATFEHVANGDGSVCKYTNTDVLKTTLKNASYTLTFGSKSNPVATVPVESYATVSFYIKNNLSEFDVNGIKVYIYDVFSDGAVTEEKIRDSFSVEFEEKDEWVKCSFFVNNNFPEKDAEGKFAEDVRSFYFSVVIGPWNVADTSAKADYSTGVVSMSTPVIATGNTYTLLRYDYEGMYTSEIKDTYKEIRDLGDYVCDYKIKEDKAENRTANYDYYSLFLGLSNKTVALYTGMSADYSDSTVDKTYTMNPSPSAEGAIISNPSNPDGFTGIDYDHGYLKSDSNNFVINDRSGNGKAKGQAGLINTKYVDTYTNGAAIKSALAYSGVSSIQPLMIYNAENDSYGYVGESISLAANGFINITVKVRVVGDAKAYIYLVDTSSAAKKVLSITVPVNTDGTNYYSKENVLNITKQMYFVVDSSMMRDDQDGWLTVEFYVANGNTARELRVELWNGSRDGENKSTGFVFFDDVYTTGSFTEPSTDNYLGAFTTEGVLYNTLIKDKDFTVPAKSLLHRRELDGNEIKYNNDKNKTGENVVYYAKYCYVESTSVIYAIYNTIEYDAVNPYDNEPEDKGSGCSTGETDPSTFWLSLSSILLAAALLFALIGLVVKTRISRKKANESDAKSHYNVSSRYKVSKQQKEKAAKDSMEKTTVEIEEETVEPEIEENTEYEVSEGEVNEEPKEETLDEYVYGDVQDFGNLETNEDRVEEDTSSVSESESSDNKTE